jgi:hypothetical protein
MIKGKKVTSAFISVLLMATMCISSIGVEATDLIIEDTQEDESIEFIIDDAQANDTTEFIIDDAQENLVLSTEPSTTNKIYSSVTGIDETINPVEETSEESTEPPTEIYTDNVIENPTQPPTYVTDVENFTYTNVTTTVSSLTLAT